MNRSIIMMCLVVAAAPVVAVEPAVLTDRELQRRPIQFVSYVRKTIKAFGEDRRLAETPSTSAVRVEFDRLETTAPRAQLKLIDGQVLVGAFVGVTGGGLVRWQNEHIGILEIDLDEISGFDLKPQAVGVVAGPVLGDDLVILANGDRITGFVERVGEAGLSLSRDGAIAELAWDSVLSVTLANPSRIDPGVWLILTDGGRFLVKNLHIAAGVVTGQAFGRELELDFRWVAAIDLAERHRLIPLYELGLELIAGGEAFGVRYEPWWNDEVLHLHAPSTVRVALPRGTRRLAADIRVPQEALDWADLEVIVLSDGQELSRKRLNRQTPLRRINVIPRDRSITFEISEADRGAVMDRLEILGAAVLVDVAPQQR